MSSAFKRKSFYLAFLISIAAFATLVQAQDKGLKKIIWGQTSISSSQWIPWIAKDAKIYEKNGLDVDIVYLRGGSGDTSKALVAGSIFAAPVTTATVMTANLAGADLTTIAHTVKAVQSKVMARPELKRPEDIKGKRLASTGLGSLGDFLHRVVIKRYGLNKPWMPSSSTPRTFPIHLMFKPRKKAIGCCGMRASKCHTLPCRW